MRIRRHAKISQLVLDTASSLKPASALLQTYDCQLNQSPWDVMTFSSPSSPPLPPSFQVNGTDAPAGNGGSDRRISVIDWKRDEMTVRFEKKVKKHTREVEVKKVQCCKTDGKSWQCKREAADGSSLCNHHLSQLKNYQHLTHKSTAKKPTGKSSPPMETTKHSTRSSNRASSPPLSREFYYYSVFRPGWSKKRSAQTSKNDEKSEVVSGTCSQVGNDEHEIDSEEDYSDVYEGGEKGRGENEKKPRRKGKRARKPVKARSLKSLM